MKNILLTILVTAVTTLLILQYMHPQKGISVSKKEESAYERVTRTGILRCGYIVYPPALIKDPNTGKLSGIMHDIIEKAAEALNLHVKWVEETTYAEFDAGLKSNRFDIMCGTKWNIAGQARTADFTIPLWYSGLGVWVCQNDDRFTNNLERINAPDVKIAAVDGTIPAIIAKEDYPQADVVSLPQHSDYTANLLNIENKKADVGFVEVYTGNDYLYNNPGSLKNIIKKPIRTYGNSMLVKQGEDDLLRMINQTLTSLLDVGFVDKIIDKYEKYPNSYYRIAKHYRLEN